MPRETPRGASFHSKTTAVPPSFFVNSRTSAACKGLVGSLGLAASSALTTVYLDSPGVLYTLADLQDELILAVGIEKTSPNYYWQFEVQT